jgi:hypothetical protein
MFGLAQSVAAPSPSKLGIERLFEFVNHPGVRMDAIIAASLTHLNPLSSISSTGSDAI